MINYLLLCIVSIFAGKGILRIFRIETEAVLLFYLSPIITLSFWAILLSIAILSGYTVKQACIPVWALTFLLVILSIDKKIFEALKKDWHGVILVLILPVVLMISYFLHGIFCYAGSPAYDGWSYTALGQYLWTYVRGTTGGLAPLYQYASHLSNGRFVASAFLGLLSPIAGVLGDTQAVSGLFLAWVIFVFTSSCMFFINIQKLNIYRFFYVVLVILSGWLLKLLWVDNYDNALILGFLPTLAGIAYIIGYRKYCWSFIVALLIAAAVYCYPETVILVIVGTGLFLLNRIFSQKEELFFWSIFLIITIILALIFVSPYLKEGYAYVVHQFGYVMYSQGGRPGEGNFVGLLSHFFMISAYWGLGKRVIYIVMGLILTCLAILGAFEILFKQKKWGLAIFCLILIFASLVMIFYKHYSYGAYKIIILNLWLLMFFVIVGVKYILDRYHNKFLYFLFGVIFILFIIKHFITAWHLDHKLLVKNITSYRRITQVREYTKDCPLMIAVDNDFANQWVVYYLRKMFISMIKYRGYMSESNVIPVMHRAQQYDIFKLHYILTDDSDSFPKSSLLKQYPPYYLWYLKSDWVILGAIQNANGFEQWDNKMGFWVGNGDTVISVLSSIKSQIIFTSTFIIGPSIANDMKRQFLILGPRNYKKEVVFSERQQLSFIIPVDKGTNKIILRALDKPTILTLPNGDARPMLFGVVGLKLRFNENSNKPS